MTKTLEKVTGETVDELFNADGHRNKAAMKAIYEISSENLLK